MLTSTLVTNSLFSSIQMRSETHKLVLKGLNSTKSQKFQKMHLEALHFQRTKNIIIDDERNAHTTTKIYAAICATIFYVMLVVDVNSFVRAPAHFDF